MRENNKRIRNLPSALMIYSVIALSLFPGVAYQSVLRWLLTGLQWLGNHPFRVALPAFGFLALFTSAPAATLPTGSGSFPFTWANKAIPVWTYRPVGAGAEAPVVFVCHGMNRNASDYRDSWIKQADVRRCIIVAPEFTESAFPGSASYNFGNMIDGNGAVRPAAEWTFNALEAIFDDVRAALGPSARSTYRLYGHSAGAQFVHRLLLFAPTARVEKAVAANAGMYTVPELTTRFPYGLAGSPYSRVRLRERLAQLHVILLGTADNDPNSPDLPHSDGADAQGPHRLARGEYFHAHALAAAPSLGGVFNWQLDYAPGVAHSTSGMTPYAAARLFEPAPTSGDFTYTPSGTTATVTDYTGPAGAVTIPGTLNGLKVVNIGHSAFQAKTAVTSVTIPPGVTTIGNAAFYDCSGLASVSIPNSVTNIGLTAFQGCSNLTEVTIPAGVTNIKEAAFFGCGNLTRANFLGNAPSLGPDVFTSAASGFKVYYSYYTGQTGFSQPTWNTYAVENLYPFTTSSSGTSVTITDYPESAVGSLVIPDMLDGLPVVSIGTNAFRNCRGLTSVTIPSSVTSLGDRVFDSCSSLTSVSIPPGVTTIGNGAFFTCSSLTSVTIPSSVTSIGFSAFENCSFLARADFLGNAPAMLSGSNPDLGMVYNQFAKTAAGFFIYRTAIATGFQGVPWNSYTIAINARPLAESQSISTLKGTALAVVLSGSDPERVPPRYRIATPPSHGKLSGTPPRLRYLPDTNFTGSDSFSFIVSDGTGDSAPATVSIRIGDGPPLPWKSKVIGSGNLAGFTFHKKTSGVFTLAGSGGFGTTVDQFRYTYQTFSGDGEITARVKTLENTGRSARIGVMIRESLATNSRQVFIGLTGKGDYRCVRRTTKGGKNVFTESASGFPPNTWLRLVRKGAEISAYKSTNGKKWILVKRVEVALPKNCYIGLTVASGSGAKLNTSEFSNVKVKP